MPVLKVYPTSSPNVTIPVNQPSRTIFRFYASTPTGDNSQIGSNLGVDSAIFVIYPPNNGTPVEIPLIRQANADFILYIQPPFLSLGIGVYPYALFVDDDYVPFASAEVGIGFTRQADQIIAVLDASRNAIKVNTTILENPQFANSESIAWTIDTDPLTGVSTIYANTTGLGPGGLILSGNGAPDIYIGTEGDFYIDTLSYEIYGPKILGDWGVPVSLIGPPGATTFTELTDVPPDYTYAGGSAVAVKPDETGLEFVPFPLSGHEIDDESVPLPQQPVLDFQGAGVSVSDGGDRTIITIPGGATNFTDLGDVPPDYAYAGGSLVSVKNDETGLEFIPQPDGDLHNIAQNRNSFNFAYTITSGYNGIAAGPISILPGGSITVPPGSTFVIM